MDGHLDILFIMGIAFFTVTQASTCPYEAPDDNSKCWCEKTTVYCSGLDEIPPLRTGPGILIVDTVIFEDGNIEVVNTSSLPPGLVKIEFYNNPLTNISRDAFQASASTLRVLSFDHVSFFELPEAVLELASLTTLAISNTNIEDWDNVTHQSLTPRLLNLTLVYAGLSAWPSWFSMFSSLTYADFSGNSLSFIPDHALNSLADTLEWLSLKEVGLTEIPQALSALRNLKSLDISSNDFKNANDKPEIEKLASFSFAKILVNLTVQSVGLTVIPNLSSLTNLAFINLGNNVISDPSSGSFAPSVTRLLLYYNRLTSVPDVIANMPGLKSISLSNNHISEIRSDMFPGSLTALNLGDNNLTEITNTSFTRLAGLVTLSLQYNPIYTISASAFKSLQSLKTLLIDGELLPLVPLALIPLPSLQTLSMNIVSLTCPCPAPQELVQWFESYKGNLEISGSCDYFPDITNYLNGSCLTTPPSTEETQTYTTSITTDSTTDNALALAWSCSCRFAYLFLILFAFLHRF